MTTESLVNTVLVKKRGEANLLFTKTWTIIDETLQRKWKKSLPRVFSHNGNAFNSYFINIGPSLANQIQTNHNYNNYLCNPSKNQIVLQPVDESKIVQVIDNLKKKIKYKD